MASPIVGNTRLNESTGRGSTNWPIFALACIVFFMLGGITNLNDSLVAKFKGLFQLDYFNAGLVQFAFFLSYGLFSIPAGLLMRRIGYVRGFVLGFAVIAAACLLFLPAANAADYNFFLFALFLIGAGITLLQVAMNPVAIALGDPAGAATRLTFAQFFNSVGVALIVWKGGEIILGKTSDVDPATLSGEALQAYRVAESEIIGQTYVVLAGIVLVLGLIFWLARKSLDKAGAGDLRAEGIFGLLRRQRLAFGCACIFLYVGAEVAIASYMINYLGQDRVWGIEEQAAVFWLTMYWTGALVGRLIGGFLHHLLKKPGFLLAVFAAGAVVLCAISAVSSGSLAAFALIAVGFANSLMFATIFTLSTEGLDEDMPQASGLLCTAIVGGAFVPLLMGGLADAAGLAVSLIVPILCYMVIASFGIYANRGKGI